MESVANALVSTADVIAFVVVVAEVDSCKSATVLTNVTECVVVSADIVDVVV